LTVRPWKEFQEEYNNKPIYTKKQHNEIVEQVIKQHTVNRVIQKGKDFDVALQILSIHSTPDGIMVIVK